MYFWSFLKYVICITLYTAIYGRIIDIQIQIRIGHLKKKMPCSIIKKMLDNVEPSILCIELTEQVLVVVVFLDIPLFFASVFFTVLFFFSLNESIMTRLGSKKNVNPNQNSMFSNHISGFW